MRLLYVRKGEHDTAAEPSEFQVAARRNGKLIDLNVYIDFPIGEYSKGMPSVDEYVMSSLGEEIYHRLIGKINVLNRREKPANANSDSDLEKVVLSILTEDERKELDSIVTYKPCVVSFAERPFELEWHKDATKLSPYIKLRPPDEFLLPEGSIRTKQVPRPEEQK